MLLTVVLCRTDYSVGVLSAMESYNEVGGVPMVSSSDYLKKLLRAKMGFKGMLVTGLYLNS